MPSQPSARSITVASGGRVSRTDWTSPCEGWSARDVVAHVVDTQRAFLEQHGLHGQDLDAGPEPDLADPAAAWRTQRAHLTSVLADSAVAG